MRLRGFFSVLLSVIAQVCAQDISVEDLGASVKLPAFNARLGVGFNYDLLRDPTSVSFEYPRGYIGFNLPIAYNMDLRQFMNYIDPAIDSLFFDSTLFSNQRDFQPRASARQNANISVQVDVPMFGGVATFANTQNFLLSYSNALGNPEIFINPDSLMEGVKFLLRGTINVPVDLAFSWETMTFGYAYKINRNLVMALNLHRHVFSLDLRAKIDVDLLGNLHYRSDDGTIEIQQELNYPSDKIYGQAYGQYDAEVWTPTIGIKAWRFSFVSRFGFTTHAHGGFLAKYSLPFFIDPETFQPTIDFNDPAVFQNTSLIQKLTTNASDSVTYSTVQSDNTESELLWKMPTGLTFSFDIIPKHLSFSYTKIIGDIEMKLDKIAREKRASNRPEGSVLMDSLLIDVGISVDNIMILSVNVFNSFLNIGVFGMDLRYADQKHLIGSRMPYMHLGKSAMIPTLNFGSAIGTKLQVLLELDVLPFPALKTGLFYHF